MDHGEALEKTGFWGRAGAGCIILALETGRILLPKRSEFVEQPHTWGVWGGAIDPNEDPAEAAQREAHEEAGANIHQMIPLYVFHDAKSGFRYYNFLGLVDKEFTPNLNWETEGYSWVNFGDWPKPLHFGLKALLSDSASAEKINAYASNGGKHE